LIDWLGYRPALHLIKAIRGCGRKASLLSAMKLQRIKPAIVPSAQKHTSLYAFKLSVTNANLQWLFKVHRAFLAVLRYIFSLCVYVPDKNGKHPCYPSSLILGFYL